LKEKEEEQSKELDSGFAGMTSQRRSETERSEDHDGFRISPE
jgi:hypothetical protein